MEGGERQAKKKRSGKANYYHSEMQGKGSGEGENEKHKQQAKNCSGFWLAGRAFVSPLSLLPGQFSW